MRIQCPGAAVPADQLTLELPGPPLPLLDPAPRRPRRPASPAASSSSTSAAPPPVAAVGELVWLVWEDDEVLGATPTPTPRPPTAPPCAATPNANGS